MWMATEGTFETTSFKGHREVGQALSPLAGPLLGESHHKLWVLLICHKKVKLG